MYLVLAGSKTHNKYQNATYGGSDVHSARPLDKRH